jgi:isocitrate dehydrogenase
VRDGTGEPVFSHEVRAGDIWRMCSTKDAPIRDWVRLAVERARKTMDPVIFWLDPKRAHDAQLIQKVNQHLEEHNLSGLDISIKEPVVAMRHTLGRARVGLDTVSVTGNVLRDYLTDLFPILELGTSSKMLSIVPLLGGGGLFETGAGGSAPKHVQQFITEGHLRWDSLGEYLAMSVSLEDYGAKHGSERAALLGQTLSTATQRLLEHRRAPSRKVGEIDNRGESFYIALYWAEALAEKDPSFAPLARELRENRAKIVKELANAQGHAVEIGGYYLPDPKLCAKAMRPSPTFNEIIDAGREVGTCGVAAITD